MDNQSVVIVTGANSGMGKATCIELAKTKATIIMLCRDQKRGEEARKEVMKQSKNTAIDLMIADLGSLESIKQFTELFKSKYDRLHCLINNAGVILPGKHVTSDQIELQFGVNHLGHFYLTSLLLDVLISSAPARVINVSSGAHKFGRIHFEDVNLTTNFHFIRAYGQSKLANVLFTYELADRLEETGVTVNCIHPGAVATNMGINRDTGFGSFITRLLKPFFQSPEQGAKTTFYLSTSPEVVNITGRYFYREKAIPSSKQSQVKEVGKKLWELSENLIEDIMGNNKGF